MDRYVFQDFCYNQDKNDAPGILAAASVFGGQSPRQERKRFYAAGNQRTAA